MMKDFDTWNNRKKEINKDINRFFHERDIWWCKLGVNVGFEEDGKGSNFLRPILIFKGLSKTTCFVLPLTTSPQIHKYRIDIGIIDNKVAKAIVSQMRVIDTKRLFIKIGVLDQKIFEKLRKTIKDLL